MREDMSKVVVERPRLGGRYKYPKGEQRERLIVGWDEAPKRESIRRKWIASGQNKNFSERLGPLWRYLLSKVGQPWNLVYRDICQFLRRDSVIQDHVRDHVDQFVEKNIQIINNRPCHGIGSFAEGLPLASYKDALYVHPKTNKLCLAKYRRHIYERPRYSVVIDEDTRIMKVKDVWYEIKVKPLTPVYRKSYFYSNYRHTDIPITRLVPFYDLLMGKMTSTVRLEDVYGAMVISTEKQQLNSKEIKHLKKDHPEMTKVKDIAELLAT